MEKSLLGAGILPTSRGYALSQKLLAFGYGEGECDEISAADLQGPALNWAVAAAAGVELNITPDGTLIATLDYPRKSHSDNPESHLPLLKAGEPWDPFKNKGLTLLLLERAGIGFYKNSSAEQSTWTAIGPPGTFSHQVNSKGASPAEAGLRCLVRMQLGESVLIPCALHDRLRNAGQEDGVSEAIAPGAAA